MKDPDIQLSPAETWKLHAARAERNFLIQIIKTSSFPSCSSLTFRWCRTTGSTLKTQQKASFCLFFVPFSREKTLIYMPLLIMRLLGPLKLSFQPNGETPHNLEKEFDSPPPPPPPPPLLLASPSLPPFSPLSWCSSEVNQNLLPPSKMQCKHM